MSTAFLELDLSTTTVDFRTNLSALAVTPGGLWLGGDEGTSITRVPRLSNGSFGPAEQPVELGAFLRLPGKLEDEADVEGMDYEEENGYLWLAGSHSLKRKKLKDGDSPKRLEKVSADGNRYLLSRLPLDESGNLIPSGSWTKNHFPAQVAGDEWGNGLLNAMRTDDLFQRFIPATGKASEEHNIPGKDNGVDIEGLAAIGPEHLLIGLRGPVVRGFAVLLEVRLKAKFGKAAEAGVLELESWPETGREYRKIFLQLGGLGVRDLCFDGNDLLILAGPTMDLPWPLKVFRWKNARQISAGDDIVASLEPEPLPPGTASMTAKAEGLAVLPGTVRQLLVAYDGPDHLKGDIVSLDSFSI